MLAARGTCRRPLMADKTAQGARLKHTMVENAVISAQCLCHGGDWGSKQPRCNESTTIHDCSQAVHGQACSPQPLEKLSSTQPDCNTMGVATGEWLDRTNQKVMTIRLQSKCLTIACRLGTGIRMSPVSRTPWSDA